MRYIRICIFAAVVSMASTASADWVNAYIGQPINGQSVLGNQLPISASAVGGAPISGWMIYIDSDPIPYFHLSQSIARLDVSIDISRLSVGSHRLIVKSWDVLGTEGDAWIWFNRIIATASTGGGFAGSNTIPIPPANATHVGSIDNLTNWSSATGAASACPNGVAANCKFTSANYNPTVQHGRDPASLAGSDGIDAQFQLFNSPAWATVIWGHALMQNINVKKFIWDMWVYVDSTNYYSSEIDFYQSGYNGQRLMIGSQCNRQQDVWDTWDESAQKWIATNIPCNAAFSAGHWHRLTYFLGTDPVANTYTYYALRVDGIDHSINQTYYGKYAGWPQGMVGVQIQIDANASGAAVNESIESMQLYAW
jgi:hypothetical protein